MKLLTIAVPCYNSQEYMHYCLQTLLSGGKEVEILIINDGSKDNTALIADQYAAAYPTIIRAIHQENKGHGGAVNTGVANATGKYFKVVDSDDWVDVRAYLKILEQLQRFEETGEEVDVFITNFVYEKEGAKTKKIMRYTSAFPENQVFTWDDAKSLKRGKYMMMHSLIYNMKLLRKSGLQLPEHTFYVDNLFVFVPLQYSKTLFYMNVDFYRYFIGREDQSVNEKVMISRIDQQIRVNELLMANYHSDWQFPTVLKNYLINHLEITTVISCALLNKGGLPEHQEKKKALLADLKEANPEVFHLISQAVLSRITMASNKPVQVLSNGLYTITQRFFGFN